MKKLHCLCIALLLVAQLSHAQMMKPSVMVVPSDVWCKENGYFRADSPDYQAALSSDMNLMNVISKINTLMSDRNFPLENLESVIKNLSLSDVEEKIIRSDEDGSSMQETVLDRLYKQTQTDIILQLSWKVNKIGPKSSITFNLQALDSYTNKQVAGAQGTGTPSFSAGIAILLEEAVISHMDIFCNRLMEHFIDTRTNGREISLNIRLFETADITFETEYNDYELTEIITNWLAKECVNHRFSKAPSTATMLQFKQVRIPVVDTNGVSIDAYGFARNLARFLKKEPYALPTKVVSAGLGKATVVIGEK